MKTYEFSGWVNFFDCRLWNVVISSWWNPLIPSSVRGTHSLYILWNIGNKRVIFGYAMK
jgi:hypothetical protein